MKRTIWGILLALSVVVPLQAVDWTTVYKQVVKDNLVWITIGESYSCTGEVIAKDMVLTAAHCLMNDKNPNVKVFLDKAVVYFWATVVKSDTYVDLALLHVVTKNKVPMVLAKSNPEPGREVAAIGYHGDGPSLIYSMLVVSIPVVMVGGTNLLPISHPLMHGMSGGPLVDSDGTLVGVNTESGPIVAFAVPIETVRAFLEDHHGPN